MSEEMVPEDVREFILKCIDSIAHLEALLLLRREPRSAWTAVAVAGRLYIEESEAKAVLKRLCAEGLITARNGNYRFDGETSGKEELVNRLASLYARHLIPITNLVHAKPSGIKAFADAFRLRKGR
jgi:predicted transcriptional regulator